MSVSSSCCWRYTVLTRRRELATLLRLFRRLSVLASPYTEQSSTPSSNIVTLLNGYNSQRLKREGSASEIVMGSMVMATKKGWAGEQAGGRASSVSGVHLHSAVDLRVSHSLTSARANCAAGTLDCPHLGNESVRSFSNKIERSSHGSQISMIFEHLVHDCIANTYL